MHWMHKTLITTSLLTALTGCASNPNSLEESLTNITLNGSTSEANTAALLLSNMALSDSSLESLEHKSHSAAGDVRALSIAYVIAKRSQYQPNINRFIDLAAEHPTYLLNHQHQLSVTHNPMVDFVGVQALSNDKALFILLGLLRQSDGADLEAITSSLRHIEMIDPARFTKAVRSQKLREEDVQELIMED
jgi:hypothetical protein